LFSNGPSTVARQALDRGTPGSPYWDYSAHVGAMRSIE